MDADGDPCLHCLFVEGIDELLIIEAPRVFRGLRLQRVADRVAFPAVGLHFGNANRGVKVGRPSPLYRVNIPRRITIHTYGSGQLMIGTLLMLFFGLPSMTRS